MCQVLYHKQATKLKNTQANYYTALFYGAFNGLLENSIYHYCTNLQINDDKLLSPNVAKRLTIALATYSRYYFDIGNHYVNIPLSLLSIFSQEGNFPYHEEIETCRLLLSIIGLGTSIYTSFDEEWSYLLFMTAASILADIGGRMLGDTLGISLASTTNKLINYTSKALSSTSDYITSAYNYGLSFWPTSEDDEKISKEGIKQVNKSKYL